MTPYNLDITVREGNSHEAIDKRKVKNKQDMMELIDKYGKVILGLDLKDVLKVYDIPIDEVEDYVRRTRARERKDGIKKKVR